MIFYTIFDYIFVKIAYKINDKIWFLQFTVKRDAAYITLGYLQCLFFVVKLVKLKAMQIKNPIVQTLWRFFCSLPPLTAGIGQCKQAKRGFERPA